VFHNLAVPVLHLFILVVKVLSLYVDELNDDDDDDEYTVRRVFLDIWRVERCVCVWPSCLSRPTR